MGSDRPSKDSQDGSGESLFRLLTKHHEIDPYRQQKFFPCGSETGG